MGSIPFVWVGGYVRSGPLKGKRADYASTRERAVGAWVASVEEGSPAWEAGLEPGMRIDAVNDQPMEDIITWRWEADGSTAELAVFNPDDGEEYACTLEREPGQDWGRGVYRRPLRRHSNLRERLPVLLYGNASQRRALFSAAARRRLPPVVLAGQLRHPHQPYGQGRGPHHTLPHGAHERVHPCRE